jgi:NAD-dependent SIR2 family protein deacetylase
LIYSNTTLAKKAAIIKTALDKSEAFIIGTGASLSAAAGLTYGNADTFNTLFSGCHDRYDLKTINDAGVKSKDQRQAVSNC